MFYTRCPDCETTFRITEAALQQAGGQVRCGRCARIFDAHGSLTDRLEEPDEIRAAGERPTDTSPAPGEPMPAGAAAGAPETDGPATTDQHAAESAPAPENEPAIKAAGGEPETRVASDTAVPDGPANDAMSSADVVAVLDSAAPVTPHWLDADATEAPRRRKGLWRAVAAGALVILVAQGAHHYRAELAGYPLAGPVISDLYARLGRPIVPRWELDRYQLRDWVAVAQPARGGPANLIIRSELENGADRDQPYPLLYLRLLDRWEETQAARLFRPDEYLASAPAETMMRPGGTITTELIIVDPGADAYGFELAVCVEGQRGIECDTDATFRD